jgi:hypothetical protein
MARVEGMKEREREARRKRIPQEAEYLLCTSSSFG